MRQVHARKDKVVSGLTRGVEFLFKKNKIDWIKGTARLGGNGRVDVFEGDRQTLEAKDIIIATGSSPRSVPGIEIDHRRIITSDDAIHLPQVPESLVVLGSGAVGVEFASIFRRFGSDVTLIELLPRLVPAEDAAISAELEKSFRRQGIRSLTGTKVTKATATAAGVEVEAQTADGKTETIKADMPSRRDRTGPCHERTGGRGARRRAGEGLHQGRFDVPHVGAERVGDRRRHYDRGPGAPAACPRLIGRRDSRGRADCRQGGAAAQLRPRAQLHVLRSRDWQRRPDRGRGEGAAATMYVLVRSRSECSGAHGWRASPMVS